ncbi:Wzz/FepE/Etk N-terminal domain-containing protein [Rosenbergiella collisarenosi]|uniref:Wzz/FepE/Etk N-terminal domain-containing protein n=1 Tax=Rosenbergiella collisarenosi TaxID=1544695 RepID=UPI001F4DD396|nr:Wzz/FepE/Etk N-terminal domain-containing protein [Rosenbergiella collisarenosi]
MHSSAIDNELDVKNCLQRLWHGKRWLGLGLFLGLVLAWAYTLVAPQKWVTVAQVTRPDLTKIADYYQELSKLSQLSTYSEPAADGDTLNIDTVIDAVYQQFLQQLASVDNRRRFWLQQASKDGGKTLTPLLLDREITSMQFTAGDKLHGTVDTITLTADSAAKGSQLLTRYLTFTGQQVASQVQQDLLATWQAQVAKVEQQIAFEKAANQAAYDQQVHQLRSEAAQSADSQTKAAIAILEQTGPVASEGLLHDQARLAVLLAGPKPIKSFTSWSYLQSPEPPISRQSPRLSLLLVMWGLVGIIIGAGIALTRHTKKKE